MPMPIHRSFTSTFKKACPLFRKIEKKYGGVQSWKAMHLPTLDIRVEQNGNRVSSDHFRLSSGLSVLSRGQIRILPVKFRSLYVNERSNPVTSGSIPVSPCQGEVKSGYFRSSSGLFVLRRGQNPVRSGLVLGSRRGL